LLLFDFDAQLRKLNRTNAHRVPSNQGHEILLLTGHNDNLKSFEKMRAQIPV